MTELDDVNIRHIKLSTGEEIIGLVLADEKLSSELLAVQRPMMIKTVQKNDSMSFLFYEWQPLSKTDTCFINPVHIVSHVECDNEVKGQYVQICLNNEHDLPSSLSDEVDFDEDEFDMSDFDIQPDPSKTIH